MSRKFNAHGYRTVALSGKDSEEKRQEAFERLAMEETDATQKMQPLDYIFSRDILNEGVDIVEVNQVIMLRPTQSPIVFIQQLGRGLRKAPGKEYVVILDFIGNYNNNFMIPVALSGDRSYNADVIRKYVISGNSTIPGASTVHFDEISKDKIFKSIDKIKGMKTLIKESYVSLKNRLGRVPLLYDFYENQDLAKQQVGNVGGYPYWSWYGFNSRVEWCACFVSWCYNRAGVSEPKFAACQSQGVPWFQSRGQWGARGYENIAPGDAIFFDWDLDGSADHVGIVIGTDGSRVYTVEGNSGDACKIKSYDLNYQCIKGYGLMNW